MWSSGVASRQAWGQGQWPAESDCCSGLGIGRRAHAEGGGAGAAVMGGAWPAAPSCGVAQAGLSGAGQGLGAVAAPGGAAAGLMLCDRGCPARQLVPSRRAGLWAR